MNMELFAKCCGVQATSFRSSATPKQAAAVYAGAARTVVHEFLLQDQIVGTLPSTLQPWAKLLYATCEEGRCGECCQPACPVDPCALAKELARSGVPFKDAARMLMPRHIFETLQQIAMAQAVKAMATINSTAASYESHLQQHQDAEEIQALLDFAPSFVGTKPPASPGGVEPK